MGRRILNVPGFLDPTTKLFSKIADTYYAEMKNLYGEGYPLFRWGSHFMKGRKNQWSGSGEMLRKVFKTSMQKN